jgi:hypothetical protein
MISLVVPCRSLESRSVSISTSFPALRYPVAPPAVVLLACILRILYPVLFEAEPCMTDTAGLHFVVSTPAQTPDKHDRKAIRSHATRASIVDRQTTQLRSWVSPDRELGSLKKATLEQAPTPESILSVPSPRRVGADFSGLQLPSGVEPYMIQDLIQDLIKCRHSPLLILTHLPLKQNDGHTSTEPD